MGRWNYRVVRHPAAPGKTEDWFAIHEVYYGDDGEPTNMSAEPVQFVSESPEELACSVAMALSDARNRPVFDPPAAWPHPKGQLDG
ncbi:hypothetical protein [Phenylobacterium sp.]|jgi:hypothetical protein|uniref:hypothetical protein n=1 Tax=Phenylobacterium sp. TaxID=1871053 RepID=UPI002E35E66D|nr:hypothetical protein [Phenylobacterium sp.]HEX4712715.1 hypothetical protein [Phenylobacterium sp.]